MSKCLLCGTLISEVPSLSFLLSFRAYRPPVICSKCRRQFRPVDPDRCCQLCGKQGVFPNQKCADCRAWAGSTTAKFRNRSLYQYNSKMREYMHRYKFQGDYRLRRVFQAEMVKKLKSFRRLIVPVPLHPDTYRKRGFNQVKGWLGTLRLTEVLQTIDSAKPQAQSTKDRRQRLRMPQPFEMVPGGTGRIKGRDLLIVDDVYTTGTTIRYAARLLKNAGAHSVIGMTLAH